MEKETIKKALYNCGNSNIIGCENCPYINTKNCQDFLQIDALDLINELEQENEKLLNFNNTLMQEKQKILQSKVVENWYNDLKKELFNFADLLKNKAKENKQNWVNNNDKNSKDLLESVSIKDIEQILHWYFKKGE